MATLPKDPKGWELEDLIAAHFASRGCYVETGVKERGPDELLELDIVWTDYHTAPEVRNPVEVKSGDWGIGDLFKFFGWTRYLGLAPGQFVYKEPCGRAKPESLTLVQSRTGIQLLNVPTLEAAETLFAALGLPAPATPELSELWRYSFWAQRRLLKSLGEAIRQGVCPECAKKAKKYHQLINDAVFFIPDVQDRVGELLDAHFDHQELGASSAYEIETGKAEFASPPQTMTFKKAIFNGQRFPIQACLYLAHRARLYVLKAVVDYCLARERGEIKTTAAKLGKLIRLTGGRLTAAMSAGAERLSAASSFRQFPVFWQVFLWSWGGILRMDSLEDDYAALSLETGVPVKEIPIALSAFDEIFPTDGGWFRQPDGGDVRRVVILMPAAIRGIGTFRRRHIPKLENYAALGVPKVTVQRMTWDHNTSARLLDCADVDLVK